MAQRGSRRAWLSFSSSLACVIVCTTRSDSDLESLEGKDRKCINLQKSQRRLEGARALIQSFCAHRDRERTAACAAALLTEVAQHPLFQATVQELDPAAQTPSISTELQDAAATIALINRVVNTLRTRTQSPSESLAEGIEFLTSAAVELQRLVGEWQALFAWHDGPLVAAMRNGDMLLVDEISLAEDSVLERLNSVLEPKRLLVSRQCCLKDLCPCSSTVCGDFFPRILSFETLSKFFLVTIVG